MFTHVVSLQLVSALALGFAIIASPVRADIAATAVQATLAVTSPALDPAVTSSTDAPATQDLPFTLRVEHLAGLAAWLPVGTFQMTANDTQDSTVLINYSGEAYAALITIRAKFVGTHNEHESWLLTVTRQDLLNGKPYSPAVTSELTLDRGGPGIRLVTKGHFGSQLRELRLGLTL